MGIDKPASIDVRKIYLISMIYKSNTWKV